MEKAWILCLVVLIVIVLLIYAVVATQLMLTGFQAIFEPETYGLNIINGWLK